METQLSVRPGTVVFSHCPPFGNGGQRAVPERSDQPAPRPEGSGELGLRGDVQTDGRTGRALRAGAARWAAQIAGRGLPGPKKGDFASHPGRVLSTAHNTSKRNKKNHYFLSWRTVLPRDSPLGHH